MLILPIEKEIETDHKIVANFNMRQVIALSVAVLAVVAFYFLIGNLLWVILCALPFAFVAAIFGWYSKNGLMVEDLALKMIQLKIYKNDSRKYRTKNSFFEIFNKAYANKRAEEKRALEEQNPKKGQKVRKNGK